MLKTIKFNLMINDRPVRSLPELQEHFHVQDIVKYHRSGLLQKWLQVRGYEEEAQKVAAVGLDDELKAAEELVRILCVGAKRETIQFAVEVLRFEQQRKQELRQIKEAVFQEQLVIHQYHQGYGALLDRMLAQPDDVGSTKASIIQIFETYASLFALDYRRFYYKFIANAPLVVLCTLMHASLRKVLLGDREINVALQSVYKNRTILNQVESHLKVFAGQTNSYWKDLEPSSKKCLIVSIKQGNCVRNQGNVGMELNADQANGQYLLLDGIDYKSHSDTDQLIYMEV